MYVRMYACTCVCMYVCIVCVCMYVCIVCVYVCMYARMYVCVYVCMHVVLCVCMYICVYVCMYVRMHACIYMYCMYVRVYVSMYVRTYVCMYAHLASASTTERILLFLFCIQQCISCRWVPLNTNISAPKYKTTFFRKQLQPSTEVKLYRRYLKRETG
jgi:hypothetical protein